MIKFVPAKSHHVEHVVANLWERALPELRRFGLPNRDAIRAAFQARVNNAHSYAMLKDDVPIAVFGLDEVPNSPKGTTWFIATDEFVASGRRATLALYRFIRRWSRDHPEVELLTLSASEHPEAERWFRILGFDEREESDGFHLLAYDPGTDGRHVE